MICWLGIGLLGLGITGVALRRDAFVCALSLAMLGQGVALLLFALPTATARNGIPPVMVVLFALAQSLAVVGLVWIARGTPDSAPDEHGW